MKKLGNRILAILLTLLLMMSASACGNKIDHEVEPANTVSSNGKVSFPLGEEMTFDIMVRYDGDLDAAL